jgi:hypothetical protein
MQVLNIVHILECRTFRKNVGDHNVPTYLHMSTYLHDCRHMCMKVSMSTYDAGVDTFTYMSTHVLKCSNVEHLLICKMSTYIKNVAMSTYDASVDTFKYMSTYEFKYTNANINAVMSAFPQKCCSIYMIVDICA